MKSNSLRPGHTLTEYVQSMRALFDRYKLVHYLPEMKPQLEKRIRAILRKHFIDNQAYVIEIVPTTAGRIGLNIYPVKEEDRFRKQSFQILP